jgi:hypothetical protein
VGRPLAGLPGVGEKSGAVVTTGDRIREFCTHHGLDRRQQDYLLGVVGEAVLVEREACARVAGGMTGPGNTVAQCAGYSDACREIAAAIRARKET